MRVRFTRWNVPAKSVLFIGTCLSRKKEKILSLFTIYFLVTASWDLELDKQMDFPEGIRLNARVCIYLLVSVCMWQTVFIQAAVLVWGRREGTAASYGLPLPQRCISLVEHWDTGCQKASRALRCMSQFHLLASGCSN